MIDDRAKIATRADLLARLEELTHVRLDRIAAAGGVAEEDIPDDAASDAVRAEWNRIVSILSGTDYTGAVAASAAPVELIEGAYYWIKRGRSSTWEPAEYVGQGQWSLPGIEYDVRADVIGPRLVKPDDVVTVSAHVRMVDREHLAEEDREALSMSAKQDALVELAFAMNNPAAGLVAFVECEGEEPWERKLTASVRVVKIEQGR